MVTRSRANPDLPASPVRCWLGTSASRCGCHPSGRSRAMTDRFPAEVARVLSESGWSPGRRTDDETAEAVRYVCDQVGRDGARTESFEAAFEALTEFGGLYVVQDGP